MQRAQPIAVEVTNPHLFQRVHVFLRILLLVAICAITAPFGWLVSLFYVAIPLLAAVLIALGQDDYLTKRGPALTHVFRFVVEALAYLMVLTDRLPSRELTHPVSVSIELGGRPTLRSSLLRLFTSLPSAIVLLLLGVVSVVLWLISMLLVLAAQGYPNAIYAFQRGVLQWCARLIGFHASLVDRYPPFSLDLREHEHPRIEPGPIAGT
jgi:hypothetical protein